MTEPAPLRVLYIDDDDGLRRLAARVLVRHGYEVTVAESGAAGLALAAATTFDVVAVDHYMPGMDGLATLEALRALPEPPPVVYVTGSEESRIAVAALKASAADYVVKSVGTDFWDLLASAFEQVRIRGAMERDKAATEARLRDSNARLAALLSEVNHRVANSLQLVTAMVRLQASALDDPAARAALEDTQRRIDAIGQVHRRLYTSENVEQVDMADYLGALVGELGEAWSTEAAPRRLSLDAETILLPTDRAVSLGVIVTELVSNACKYAYVDAMGGEVRVALHRDGTQHFKLVVEDDGVGMKVDAPARGTGVGTKLIRAMGQSLQAAIEYDSGHRGVRATLRAALS
ncbi:histidine kinase dimerization/phosphoacceptor domain -containing protein [Sphingomonas sp. AR_OL41]|uniref:sensor histidine kinase n=1 Tax=Sphingomonas sp. AR_OL41 TaxID=3042729 RepID=UPI00248187E8|nr:histidine kinase dimerization/phosphoacceptor domain -containing protein [Sphingomonas sp. AR_OL41]MDH7973464.1 histidine kinase dimerization/phosphoacceptor domain -containing protein [Sphingomonas sp. AR_OL41]